MQNSFEAFDWFSGGSQASFGIVDFLLISWDWITIFYTR